MRLSGAYNLAKHIENVAKQGAPVAINCFTDTAELDPIRTKCAEMGVPCASPKCLLRVGRWYQRWKPSSRAWEETESNYEPLYSLDIIEQDCGYRKEVYGADGVEYTS